MAGRHAARQYLPGDDHVQGIAHMTHTTLFAGSAQCRGLGVNLQTPGLCDLITGLSGE